MSADTLDSLNPGFQECPLCKNQVHVATGGDVNLEFHMSGAECLRTQKKAKEQEKISAQAKNFSAWFSNPAKAKPTHSFKLNPPPPLHHKPTPSLKPVLKPSHSDITRPPIPISPRPPDRNTPFSALHDMEKLSPLERVGALTMLLPSSIPVAHEDNAIWQLGTLDPSSWAETNCSKDRLGTH
ncbi:uncharacterized protein EI90DRAFT_3117304 [Cantharellus anzutake]|uniref:uncharacterized protein n=1 Tax=Cantharellus anzutake TaxID=1750568 RepID=UPI001906C0B8|nr:uncharacterized protein EI90DRAFT_3117304 [Cantharellus anzutake]KAF8340753.1 hypothetical protein EI90DRAFT_3117304 [Cantharellus anzutake]